MNFIPLIVLGIFSFVVALIIIAGWFENLESDTGSQSNPNSQVQLAPQVGHPHRIFNKAISGEPVSHALYGLISGTFFTVLWWGFNIHPLISLSAACALTTCFHMTLAVTSFLGRTTSHNVFGQPIFLDVLLIQLPLIAAYGFICTTVYTSLSYIFYSVAASPLGLYFGYPLPIPILGFMFGLVAGSIGSSTGDIHHGTEREFQHIPFGEGVAMKDYGNITVKAELGYRNSSDITYYTAKFGGPLAGLAYGLIILFDNYRLIWGSFSTAAITLVAGIIIIVLLALINRRIEVWSRKKFGIYEA